MPHPNVSDRPMLGKIATITLIIIAFYVAIRSANAGIADGVTGLRTPYKPCGCRVRCHRQ
jgi:hypothetical protein